MGALGGFWVSGGGVRCGSGDGVTCRGGLCGIDPALAGKLGGGSAFALRAGFFLWIASNARSGPIPLPPAGGVCGRWVRLSAFGYGCAGRFLGFWWWGALWFWRWGGMPLGALRDRSCARREARGRIGFCAARRFFLWIASNARSGSIPLPPAGGVVWEVGEAFSLWIWVRWEVSGFLVVGCAVVLAMGWDAVGGSAGSVLRSQGSSREDRLLRCAQVFFVDRFQCSLRIDPAAACWGRRMNQMQKRLGRRRFPVQHLD
jgi:hypothetical protein